MLSLIKEGVMHSMKIPGIDAQTYEVAINGELTFYGVLETYYEEFSKYWNEQTKETYGMHYQELILPFFAGHPLRDFDSVDEFQEIIEKIREKGTLRSKGCETYGESTLRHFKHLIKIVIDVAAKHGVCPNVLWGSGFKETDSCEEDPYAKKEKARMRLPRSIDPEIYVQILKLLMTDPRQDGVQMALLLMCILGLRNKEACSVWWSDIEEIANHPGCYVLVVHSSAVQRELYRSSGGKTANMYRKIPIPAEVYEFLMARKDYVQQIISEQNIDIMRMPIACNRKTCWEHCLPGQITAMGREIFRKVGFSEDAFYMAEQESDEDDSGFPGVKAPTAYTFRREYCTARYALGYTPEEIEYCMGHKISSDSIKRRYFSNPDNLYRLWAKAAQQPLLATCDRPESVFYGESILLENVVEASIDFSDYVGDARIRVVANEPFDAPRIALCAENMITYDVAYQRSLQRGDNEVNINHEYRRLHQRGLKRDNCK